MAEELGFAALLDEYMHALISQVDDQKRVQKARQAVLAAWRTEHDARGAVCAAGDRLAHEMLYTQHRAALDLWWESRGGHEKCTACHPAPVIQAPPGLPQCACTASDAWQCSRELGLMFVTCRCSCHRGSRTTVERAS